MSLNVENELQAYADKMREENVENTNQEATEQVVTNEANDQAPDKAIDEVVVEEKATDELLLVAEETPQVITPTEEIVIEEEKPINVSKYTDGEFESIDDLVAQYKSLKENVITGDSVMELLDKQSQENFGLSFSEVVAWKNIDYSKMGEFDVLAEYHEFKDPEITDIEIDAELAEFSLLRKTKEEITKMIEDEEITQSQYDITLAKFTKQVRQARTELSNYRDGLGLDKIKIGAVGTPQPQKQATEEDIKATKESYANYLKNVSKFKMVVDDKDGTSMDYVLNDSDKNTIAETISNPQWLLNRWQDADGSINQSKVVRDANILINATKLIKAAYSEGANRALKNHVVNENNITLGQGRQIQSNEEKNITSISEQLMSSMM